MKNNRIKEAYILSIDGKTVGVHTSFAKLIRDIGRKKAERKHRREVKLNPILTIGNIKIERTPLIISKRKSRKNGNTEETTTGTEKDQGN